MRLFIAISLSEKLCSHIINLQSEMYSHGFRGRFSPKENLHLTLAFIGDYPDPDMVLDALSSIPFTPFELTLEGLGFFGDICWVGVKDSPALEAAARIIRRALANAGIPFDRKKFRPHITVSRKTVFPHKTGKELPGIRIEPLSMTVEKISLFRSDRGKNGMIYTELE